MGWSGVETRTLELQIRRNTSVVSPCVFLEDKPLLGELADVPRRLPPCNVWADRHVWDRDAIMSNLQRAASAPAGPGLPPICFLEAIRHQSAHDFSFTL